MRNYKAFLENNMSDFSADVPPMIGYVLRFIHDGLLAHFRLTRGYLNPKLPGRWIRKGGAITGLHAHRFESTSFLLAGSSETVGAFVSSD
jgi:hypothetical protein